jgi:transposase-like protein
VTRWTKALAVTLANELLAGTTKDELAARYGVQFQALYKTMNHYGVYPYAPQRISVVKLRALYQEFAADPTKRVADLAATIGLTKNALRSRWLRLKLKAPHRKQKFPDRKMPWKVGYTIWMMRSKGQRTREICAAIGQPYEPQRSARYIRHHLLRWCYDTHAKVPSFEHGTFKVKWLPPPTEPPT